MPAIPEEDEATATRRPKVENPDTPTAAHLKHMFDWDDSNIEILLNMMMTDLERFLNNLI